jgi:hypothetical protein
MTTETLNKPDEQVETDVPRLLTAHDRCDKMCGAQAWFIAVKDDKDLVFCKHHGNEYELALIAAGWMVYDQSDRIDKN